VICGACSWSIQMIDIVLAQNRQTVHDNAPNAFPMSDGQFDAYRRGRVRAIEIDRLEPRASMTCQCAEAKSATVGWALRSDVELPFPAVLIMMTWRLAARCSPSGINVQAVAGTG
jgi:hypothetical protein